MTFILKKYRLESGRIPFDDWLAEVTPVFRARIHANLARVEVGNWGNVKAIQDADAKELYELRMFLGPGFRAYFGKDGSGDTPVSAATEKPAQGHIRGKTVVERMPHKERRMTMALSVDYKGSALKGIRGNPEVEKEYYRETVQLRSTARRMSQT